MKNHNNNRKLYWMLPLVAVLIGFGCKKEKEPGDYRSKYVGTWDFKVHKTQYNLSVGPLYADDTYTGLVRSASDNQVTVKYTAQDSMNVDIDEYGRLTLPANAPAYCSGQFGETGKLTLYLRWGTQGMGLRHDIDGQKQ